MDSALSSRYIIDGVPQEFTPVELLGGVGPVVPSATVVDETVDPVLETHEWDPAKLEQYSGRVSKARRRLPLPYSDVYTRFRMSGALVDALWTEGHFKLDDLALKVDWKWNFEPVGAQAAFYKSVQAAADYADALGLPISSWTCASSARQSEVTFGVGLGRRQEEDPDRIEEPKDVSMMPRRLCPATLQPDPDSWLVFIPFDTSDFRLGGSLLAQAMNYGGGVSPQIQDADYFIDCYEVVRELVEDGVVISGVTVEDGGLLSAAKKYCAGGPGVTLDLSDALAAFEETNVVRVLFAEVPGAIIQIRDIDYDYIDAEFLLQDIAFFPLGHPDVKSSGVRVKSSSRSSIQNILASLMQNAEGED